MKSMLRSVPLVLVLSVLFYSKATFGTETLTSQLLAPDLEGMPGLPMGPFVRVDGQTILTVDLTDALTSVDGGKTWVRSPLFHEEGKYEVRPERALLRTRDGAIVLAFLNAKEENWGWDEDKSDTTKGVTLPTYAMRSPDGGKTWETPQKLHDEWSGAVRDIIQTKDGLVIFTSMIMQHDPGRHAVVTYSSSDNGKTWLRSNILDLGGVGHHGGTLESTLVERKDGTVWMLLRTNWGYFWEAISYDGGRFWRTIRPTDIAAGSAPGLVKRLQSGRMILLWNRPYPEGKSSYKMTGGDGQWSEVPVSDHRGELSMAFSEDEGVTWSKPVVIATLKDDRVAYPYLFEAHPGELWITTMQGDVRAKAMERDWRPQK